jgi:glycine/D-amino acid oxidase-like deaminating enzyme
LIDSADVVVIGSGAFGASAAYHLARRGLRVAVLERSALASQTSPRAAGLSSQVRATPALTKLAQRAVAKLTAFTGETGQPLRFTQSGALKIARTERDAEQLAREVKRGSAGGVPIDFVSVAEARKRLPILGERGIVAVTWSPTDCNVEPSELPIGYCRAAEKLGAVLLPNTPATGFEIGARGIEGMRTPRGTIATRAVVDAAGARARVVAAGLGAVLPVVPTRHQLLITEPIAGVGPEFPIARVIDANVYVRHERGGLMLGSYEGCGGDRYLVGPLPDMGPPSGRGRRGGRAPALRGRRRVDRRRGAGPLRDLPRAGGETPAAS